MLSWFTWLFAFRMSKLSQAHLLLLFNCLAITCLKFNRLKRIFEISKLFSILNSLQVVQLLLSTIFVVGNKTFLHLVYNVDIAHLAKVSSFSYVILLSITYLIQSLACFVCALQFLRRKQIMDLINTCCEFSIGKSLKQKFYRVLKVNCLVVFTYLINMSCLYFWFMKTSMLSVVAFYVLMYPNLVIFSFLGFKKNFEHFLVILLKDFESDLERFLEKSYFDTHLHGCLVTKYQRIIELNNKFNKYVGPQMTMAVCCLTGILICQVCAVIE